MYSLEDMDELGVNAPEPLDASSVDGAGLQTLSRGEGAVSAKRDGAQRQDDAAGLTMSMPRRTIVALVAGATVVIIAGIALFIWVFIAPGNTSNQTAPMRMEAAVDESVPYRDASYSLKENNGTYTLVETHTDGSGNEVVLGSLHGAPVCLVLFDGSIAVPENLPDGAWDIAAYTVGTGWGLLSNQSGEAYGGQGTISEAKLDGQTLRLVVDGQPVEVPMEW